MSDTANADALKIKQLKLENANNLKKIRMLERKKKNPINKDDVKEYWETQYERVFKILRKTSIHPLIYSALQYDPDGMRGLETMSFKEGGDTDDDNECYSDCDGDCDGCRDNLLNDHPTFMEEVRAFKMKKNKKK